MPFIKCPSCRKEISNANPTCPYCHHPISAKLPPDDTRNTYFTAEEYPAPVEKCATNKP